MREHMGYVEWKKYRTKPPIKREALVMCALAVIVLCGFVALCIKGATP
jgi:hypothetical protein